MRPLQVQEPRTSTHLLVQHLVKFEAAVSLLLEFIRRTIREKLVAGLFTLALSPRGGSTSVVCCGVRYLCNEYGMS